MTVGPEPVFDRRSVRLHRDRAAARIDEAAPLLSAIADRLLDRLDDTTRRFSRALDLGGRHGLVAEALRARGIPFVVSADLSPRLATRAARSGPAIAADEEWLPFAPASFDLIVSCLSLHWVNDLPGALIQIRRALVPDGLFLAVMPGLGTLAPLRAALLGAEAETTGGASPRVSPFADLADAAALLQRAGFALPVADGDTLTVTYDDPVALIRDLRALGETNAVAQRSRRIPPRALFASALARLPRDGEGRIALPLVLLTLTGWAPAESQPKPLRPGSAAARLADALGAVEHAAGETPPLAPSGGAR
ncbi:methyltransferase domain-containing protein [Elioraea thermophila]|uniref:methyltransferase domain-containing protein n=1 Tax=Elioraea thermophila TaxID=2185104 RepID=UPI000DF33C56|nr:methyltransferase domain-containing protein [Elioraea thermophila]